MSAKGVLTHNPASYWGRVWRAVNAALNNSVSVFIPDLSWLIVDSMRFTSNRNKDYSELAVGIDFGTTNTRAAVWWDDEGVSQFVHICDSEGRDEWPSLIGLTDDNDETKESSGLTFGFEAAKRLSNPLQRCNTVS